MVGDAVEAPSHPVELMRIVIALARDRGWPSPSRSRCVVSMKISIHSLLDGAQRFDVFRAFTTAAVALANGASKVIMVGAVEEALALRKKGISDICMGEVGGSGFASLLFPRRCHAAAYDNVACSTSGVPEASSPCAASSPGSPRATVKHPDADQKCKPAL